MKLVFFIFFQFLTCLACCQDNQQLSSLSYPESTFNADTCCWRKLSSAGQNEAAAQLILSFLRQNKKVNNKHALNWHAGQCFAMAGQNEKAKKYMEKTYSDFYRWFGGKEGKMWYYYASGTMAFLDRDKNKLAAIEKKWNKRFPPALNYWALAALLENWDKLYKDVNRKI